MTTSSPSVKITSLPYSLLRFPPDSRPEVLPPPSNIPTFAHPFTIPTDIYNALLHVNVPITVALLYMTTVTYLNRFNAQRKHKPWAISKTRLFFVFVVAHNVLLALYSAWTCLGMINAIRLSFPGWNGPYGLAGVVDSMCKINGPRGIGAAATYDPKTSSWAIANRTMHLGADGLNPDSTDVGRIWNEGLAFYGWLFYLSKFYEVLDTFIILAKGRKSSFLQTYHHAGAMMCMWAGIRYMAPPIWMFVLVNSALHALMYTYYTFTALTIRVPTIVKKVLTSLQIAQFVVGASFAFAHLFIAYTVPVSVPYTFSLAAMTSAISAQTTDAASAVSVATATASAGVASWVKKLAFRAAGREGVAENVVNEYGETFGIDAVRAVEDLKAREETRYRDELQWIHCTDTSGQTFAILLNCMYLAPLTFLFVRFFIRAYSKRLERRRSSTAYNVEQSVRDAFHGVARQAVDAIGDMHGPGEDETASEEPTESSKKSSKEESKPHKESPSERKESGEQPTTDDAESSQEKSDEGKKDAKGSSKHGSESSRKKSDEGKKDAKDSSKQGAESSQKKADEGAEDTNKPPKEDVESSQKTSEEGKKDAEASPQDATKSSQGSTEQSSASGTAASTEPMAEGGNLADMKTELHEAPLQ